MFLRQEAIPKNIRAHSLGDAPITYDELWREVWHCQPPNHGSNDAIKSCVKRLREAIEPDPHNPRYVLAVRNYGYMMPTHVDTTSPASNESSENV